MKKIIILISLFLYTNAMISGIAEVKVDGGYAKIYDDNASYTGHSIYLGSSNTLEGWNTNYVVIKEGSYAKVYNSSGGYTGNSIYLPSSCSVRNVGSSVILIKEGSYVKYYDFRGSYTGKSTYDPK